MKELAMIVAAAAVYIAALSGMLHVFPRLGSPGKAFSGWLCRAPGLDLLVSALTWVPPTALGILYGWRGVVGSLLGQAIGMVIWCWGHELANLEHARGPRIVKFLNKTVGRFNNHVALWVTVVSFPIFVGIRLGELLCYPPLKWILRMPSHNHAEWVNVSRQKFNGLVGHDRIWCLYCDWMTGVYSLGAEMLRNVESFWCPIKFASGKKCDNCKLDFPDINGGWVAADGNMADVVAKMEEMYGEGARAKLPTDAKAPWFGHKVRLTVEGKGVEKP
jgi:hypothetical protein